MSILILIIFGAIVGWLASVIMGTNQQQGLIADIILGIIGAAVGGWLMNLMGEPGVTGFDLYSTIVGVVGAIILIYIGRLIMRSRAV